MVLLAFSLQSEIEKYGAYVGIASFFGLAILSLLYFAQAREVKRLRDWAGRAPERAAEVEALAIAHAEEARRTPAPAPAAQPANVPPVQRIAAPAAAPANGDVALEPAQIAALAFARAAGVRTPHPPRPHPAPVAAAPADAPPTEVAAAAGAATAAGDTAAVQDVAAGNGHGTGAVPAPATPAARRAEAPPEAPRPAAPLRRTPGGRAAVGSAPSRRGALAGPPARRESSARTVVLSVVVGVLVLAAAAFAVVKLAGGGSGNTPAPQPKVSQAGQSTPSTPSATATAQATPGLTKASMRVAVYNGTTVSGLAGSVRDQLLSLGYNGGNLGADTYTPNQQRQSSVVMYERGDKPAAATVAHSLGISDVRLIDTATQQLIQQSGKKWDVVVIVGADKSQ
jgi:LytR cell envelope-related transcriptional attenuator